MLVLGEWYRVSRRIPCNPSANYDYIKDIFSFYPRIRKNMAHIKKSNGELIL